jgi:hypothetical protein
MRKKLPRWLLTGGVPRSPGRLFPGGSAPLYHPDLGMIIYSSPKAGSTVITAIFFQAIGELDNALALNRFVHKYEHQIYMKRDGYKQAVVDAAKRQTPALKFVRDPLARALSMYLELTRTSAIDGPTKPWFYDYRRRIIREVHGTDDPYYGFSFREFLDWRAEQENDQINRHLQEQTRPVADAFLKPTIIKVEEIRAELRRFPKLDEAYRVVESRGLLHFRHHKPKAEMSDEEAWGVINNRTYCGLMPPLKLGSCPKPELRQLLEKAFPQDMETIAPLYETPVRAQDQTAA